MQLTDPSIAQLYTIAAADWTAINKRVGMVLMVQNIAGVIDGSLPGFSNLETACQSWSASTFQSLIDHSGQLNTYAGTAIQHFTDLQTAVNALTGSTVPPAVQQQTITVLTQLQADTAPLWAAFSTLSQQVANFMNINAKVDAELSQYQQTLGSYWAPVQAIVQAVDHATGWVDGAFEAITADLKNTLSGQITVDMPFLEGLDISVAIVEWQRIQAETTAFASLANDQKQYWTNPN